jgi:hypothetical protein
VQVPHAAVHNVPGWLPPGATAAAVAAAATASDQAGAVTSSSSFAGVGQPGAPGPGPSGADGLSDGTSAANTQRPAQAPAAATAGWQDPQGSGESGAMSSLAFLDYPSPCSSLGSRRPASDADPALYSRQAARQAAGRERCKVPEEHTPAATAPAADAGDTRGVRAGSGGSLSVGRRDEGVKGPGAVSGGEDGAAAGAVISLDVYAERVLFSVPHDEAPGRIIVVTETWAKAVKEVRELGLVSKLFSAHNRNCPACTRSSHVWLKSLG